MNAPILTGLQRFTLHFSFSMAIALLPKVLKMDLVWILIFCEFFFFKTLNLNKMLSFNLSRVCIFFCWLE